MNMALLGMSALIASLTYLAYCSQFSSYWCSAWARIPSLQRWRVVEEEHHEQDKIHQSKIRGANGPEDKPVQSTEEETGAVSRGETREASTTVRSPAKRKDALREEDKGKEHFLPNPTIASTPSVDQQASKTNIPIIPTTTLTPLQQMPPPPRPDSFLRAPPTSHLRAPLTATSSLRVPRNSPLPNRGPPSTTSASLSPTTSTLPPSAPTNFSRKKVMLTPGHSPIDWAALTRSTNLSGVPHPLRITPSQLTYANGRNGRPAWSAYKGKVYNIAPYLSFHPGGEGELMRGAGRDGEKAFMEVHPWVNWENMLGGCLVGFSVGEGDAGVKVKGQGLEVGPGQIASELEDMD